MVSAGLWFLPAAIARTRPVSSRAVPVVVHGVPCPGLVADGVRMGSARQEAASLPRRLGLPLDGASCRLLGTRGRRTVFP